MARPIPPERLQQLITAATSTFITRGYRQAQIADVANSLGVAKGTIYGYVESKEALFHAALRFADHPTELPGSDALPLRTPAPGQTVSYVRGRLADEMRDMTIARVIEGTLFFDDTAEELGAVLGDLYVRLSRNRFAIKLVDRSAVDHPELAAVWFGRGRWAQHELLVELIRRRVAERRYCPVDGEAVVARTLLESVAFWALHRHFDPSPQAVDDEDAMRSIIDLFTRSLVKERA